MRLKQARRVSGKSQQEVAVENDLAVSGYRRIESGDVQKPGITSVYGIARSIGVDPHDIDEFATTLNEYATAISLTATVQQQSSGVERFYSRERFEVAVEREVERRLALASQSNEVRVTSQESGQER